MFHLIDVIHVYTFVQLYEIDKNARDLNYLPEIINNIIIESNLLIVFILVYHVILIIDLNVCYTAHDVHHYHLFVVP